MSLFHDALQHALPEDAASATLAGRVWRPDAGGPSVVALRGEELIDVTRSFPTMRDLCETPDPAAALRSAFGEPLGRFDGDPGQHPARDPRHHPPLAAGAGRPAGVEGGGRDLRACRCSSG